MNLKNIRLLSPMKLTDTKATPGLPFLSSIPLLLIMNEETPLLQKQATCNLSEHTVTATCCSLKKKKKQPVCNELPPINDQDYCFLADQKWEYKSIALMCAIFLAGNVPFF
jgi:hypothetical protein